MMLTLADVPRIYMVKTLEDETVEAYDRQYAYIGDVPAAVYSVLFRTKKQAEDWENYNGGHGSPRGKTVGYATWWEPTEVTGR
jgi:hypothetical protein